MAEQLLDVRNLRVRFETHDGIVRAVDGDAEWELSGPVAGRLLGFVEEPGQYVVRASPEAEYVFEPREVRIRAGERTEVDIAVRPNR